MMRRRRPPPMMRVGLLVASGVLLTAAALWAGSVGPWTARPQGQYRPRPQPTSTYPTSLPTQNAVIPPPPSTNAASSWNPSIVLIALGVVLVLGLLLILAAMIRNDGPGPVRPKPAPEAVRPSFPAPDPDRPFDPREAADYVIGCWDELEHQAAARGKGRRREQTPTEFIQALESVYPLDGPASAELLGLYQRARFDHVRLLPDTAARARACADTLIAAVTSSWVAR